MAMKIRTVEHFIREVFVSLKRNNWMSFASIGTVAVSLLILGMFLIVVLNLNKMAASLESQVQISVYLQDDLKQKDVGGSGKSMLLKLISLFVGEDAVISTPLQDFTKPFALAEFATRRLNLVGELDIKKISESGMIKSIIGQDIITVNRKFKTQETFRATIKQVFAANQMPIVADNIKSDKAFFKRFQFISFEHEISTKDVISNYEQKLFQEEKDGIFWILVEALHKFHARGCKFNLSKQAKRLRDEFQNTHSPIESFLTECVVLDKTLSISSQVLYDAYEEYVMNKTLLCWEEKEMTIKRFIKAFQDFTKIKSSKIWFSQCNIKQGTFL